MGKQKIIIFQSLGSRVPPNLVDTDQLSLLSPHRPPHSISQLHSTAAKNISFQINALNLVGKIGQPSSFGEKPPIRREKARPFRSCTIKVSGEKPANTREFPSPFRAESMFA
jgi:hypothetical protein